MVISRAAALAGEVLGAVLQDGGCVFPRCPETHR
jgi:hypothetical protein